MVRNRKTPSPNLEKIPVRLSSDDKEGRRLFEARGFTNTTKTLFQRSSQKELLVLGWILLATNLMVGLLVYSYAVSTPATMIEFTNWTKPTSATLRRKKTTPDIRIDPSHKTQTEIFTPVPPEHYKTFFYNGERISFPVVRAFRSRGWRRVDSKENAHVIYTYKNKDDWLSELKPWQRFNYIPGHDKWNGKMEFAFHYQKYEKRTGKPPSMYVPESFMLTTSKEDIETFRRRIQSENGKNHPWVHKLSNVNQGNGITILGPNSPELLGLPDKSLQTLENYEKLSKMDSEDLTSEDEYEMNRMTSIVQQYICNEMTWDRRKFDTRMYWFVASLDPLIVLYHDGYVRVGNSDYNEESFENTRNHLTSHTGLGAETKATFSQLEELVNSYGESLNLKFNGTPMDHLRSQFKHALAEMIERMKDESFALPDYKSNDPEMSSENSFQFYCADFILDKDLDAWFIEPQSGCGLDEDYYFRLEMHTSLFNGMVDILEEVGRKQEQNQPLLPLEKSGNWEVIYADGYAYTYDGYERSTNKPGCKAPTSK